MTEHVGDQEILKLFGRLQGALSGLSRLTDGAENFEDFFKSKSG